MKKFLCLILIAIMLVGCGKNNPQTEPAAPADDVEKTSESAKETTIIFGVPSLATTLDFETPMTGSGYIINLMRDRGMRYSNMDYPYDEMLASQGVKYFDTSKEMEGALLESWEFDDDAKHAVFHVRQGVTSQWGSTLTAEDFRYTLDRAFALAGFQAWLYGCAGITGADNLNVIDEYTFEITLDEPNGLLRTIFAHSWAGIYDAAACKEHATDSDPWATEWAALNNAGYSPYELTEWVSGEYMTWKARDDWYAGKAGIDTIIVREIPESANRVAMLESGDIDITIDLSPDELKYLDGTEGVKIYNVKTANSIWVFLNNQVTPFDNQLVRQAMVCAMPSQIIANDVFQGYATPLESMIPSNIAGASDYWPYEYNLEKAKELLADAGYPEGFDCTITYDSANALEEKILVAYQSSLAQIGVNLTLNSAMTSAVTEQKYAKTLDMCIETGMPVLPDINLGTRLYFEPGGSNNFGNYENDEVLNLLNEGAKILDPDERNEFHQQIQQILVDEVCAVPVVTSNLQVGMREDIKGDFVVDTANCFRFDQLVKE